MKEIQKTKLRNKTSTMIISSVLILILFVTLQYLSPIITFVSTIIYYEAKDGFVRIYSPSERNHLVFKNNSVKNVVDSINVFRDLLIDMNLAVQPNFKNKVYFDYNNGELRINERRAGDFNYEHIRRDPSMLYASDRQVKRFISLFNNLLDNYIDPCCFSISDKVLTLSYKDLFKMYPNQKHRIEIEDFRLIDVLPNSSFVQFDFMVLDSFENIYLLAYKQNDLDPDDVKYIRKER